MINKLMIWTGVLITISIVLFFYDLKSAVIDKGILANYIIAYLVVIIALALSFVRMKSIKRITSEENARAMRILVILFVVLTVLFTVAQLIVLLGYFQLVPPWLDTAFCSGIAQNLTRTSIHANNKLVLMGHSLKGGFPLFWPPFPDYYFASCP